MRHRLALSVVARRSHHGRRSCALAGRPAPRPGHLRPASGRRLFATPRAQRGTRPDRLQLGCVRPDARAIDRPPDQAQWRPSPVASRSCPATACPGSWFGPVPDQTIPASRMARHAMGGNPPTLPGAAGILEGRAAFETSSSAPRLHRRDPGMRHSSRRPAGSCRGRCSRKPSATCVRAQTQASTSRSRLRGWRRRLTRERTALRAPAATGLLQVCRATRAPPAARPVRADAPRDVADPEAALHLRR